jgi:invasion protein IalB
MKFAVVTAIVVVACSFPLAASEPMAASAGTAQPAETAAEEKLICTVERKTGSRMTERICRTRAQVDADRAQARDAMAHGGLRRTNPRADEQSGFGAPSPVSKD